MSHWLTPEVPGFVRTSSDRALVRSAELEGGTPMAVAAQVSTDFVLVEADWPVDHARDLLDSVESSHVIVFRRRDEQDYWYLFVREEVQRLLTTSQASTVGQALDLHEWRASP